MVRVLRPTVLPGLLILKEVDMRIFLMTFHILASVFLIMVVLLQSGKGAEIGAAFGGSSQTLFGSRGAATFLNKLTTISAIIFMLTSLLLTISTSKRTVTDNITEQKKMSVPQQPQVPQMPAAQNPAQPPAQQVPQPSGTK